MQKKIPMMIRCWETASKKFMLGFAMKNWIYELLWIRCTLKTKSLMRQNQWKEYYHYIGAFQEGFCKDMLFLEDDVKIVK